MVPEVGVAAAVALPEAAAQVLGGAPAAQAGAVPLAALHNAPLVARLQWLCAAVQSRFPSSVCVLQAWCVAHSPEPGPDGAAFCLFAEPQAGLVSDEAFLSFRLQSCRNVVQFKSSLTGRTWKSGAVQMVQQLRLVPPSMHPRVYLTDADLDKLGEALYIPVYDMQRPGSGPLTVLEVLLPASSPDAIIAADLLSFIGTALGSMQLSISNPAPQPVQRSALSGRRARPPGSVGADESMPATPQPAETTPPPHDTIGVSTAQGQPESSHFAAAAAAAAAQASCSNPAICTATPATGAAPNSLQQPNCGPVYITAGVGTQPPLSHAGTEAGMTSSSASTYHSGRGNGGGGGATHAASQRPPTAPAVVGSKRPHNAVTSNGVVLAMQPPAAHPPRSAATAAAGVGVGVGAAAAVVMTGAVGCHGVAAGVAAHSITCSSTASGGSECGRVALGGAMCGALPVAVAPAAAVAADASPAATAVGGDVVVDQASSPAGSSVCSGSQSRSSDDDGSEDGEVGSGGGGSEDVHTEEDEDGEDGCSSDATTPSAGHANDAADGNATTVGGGNGGGNAGLGSGLQQLRGNGNGNGMRGAGVQVSGGVNKGGERAPKRARGLFRSKSMYQVMAVEELPTAGKAPAAAAAAAPQ